MRKIFKNGFLFLCLGLFVCVGASYMISHAQESWTEVHVLEEYNVGDIFIVPKRDVIVGGEKVTAKAIVQTPEGDATTKGTVKLETPGMYTITYTATSGDKTYVDEVSIQAYQDYYTITGDKSSATWGKYEHANLTEGLLIRLEEGEKVTINEPIDVAGLTAEETLIEAFATPDVVGEMDFGKLCFQLTDYEDPEVTLYISAKQYDKNHQQPQTYLVAGGNGQKKLGYEKYWDRLHEEGTYGTAIQHSFGLGHEACTYPDVQNINISLDMTEMMVYGGEMMVIDLNEPKYYDNLWEGFPSGRAILTIWAENYNSETANFCLNKVGNLDLTQEKLIDEEPPTITVDTEYVDMPPAVKGGTYKVPKAKAWDLYGGEREVKTSVWFNYNSGNSSVIKVKKGTFKTTREGLYAIVYEATDKAGNEARTILWVRSRASLEKPTITLVNEPKATATVGDMLLPVDYSYECHSGNPEIRAYAILGKEKTEIGDGLRLEKKGKYTITYEITDCAGQVGSCSYTLDVKMGDRPVLVDEIVLPKYLIEDVEYVFPKVYFNDYRSGKTVRKVAKGVLTDAKGTKNLKAGDTYKPQVNANQDKVTLEFKCEKASYKVEIPVIKAWGMENGKSRLILDNYFIGSGFSISKDETVRFQATAPDGQWMFAKQLLANGFSAEIKGVPGSSQYEALVLTLVDSVDATKKLVIELLNTEEKVTVQIGDQKQALALGTAFDAGSSITVKHDDGKLYVGGVGIAAGNYDGFTSEYVYCSLGFKGASAGAAYDLISLNGHTMNKANTDRIGPWINILGNSGGSFEHKSEIVLPAALAEDVLNPNITFTMTVTNGKDIMKDVNGKKLENVDPTKEYTIKAKEFGRYNVTYNASENFSEKTTNLSYVIHITDNIAPEVEFASKYQTEAKVGDTLTIPNYTVTDNVSPAEEIVVLKYVYDANGMLITIPENSNSVVASEAGTYEFMIMAFDAERNINNVSWTVTVTDK